MEKNRPKPVLYKDRFRQRRRWLYLFILFDFIFSASIILIPFALNPDKVEPIYRYLIAVFFWIGLIGIIAIVCFINYKRKHSKGFNAINKEKKKLGLICFFQNRYAVIVDILMFANFLGALFAFALKKERIAISLLGLFAFSFNLHCMLNGICYEYINYKMRRENTHGNSKNTLE